MGPGLRRGDEISALALSDHRHYMPRPLQCGVPHIAGSFS